MQLQEMMMDYNPGNGRDGMLYSPSMFLHEARVTPDDCQIIYAILNLIIPLWIYSYNAEGTLVALCIQKKCTHAEEC